MKQPSSVLPEWADFFPSNKQYSEHKITAYQLTKLEFFFFNKDFDYLDI